MYAHSNNSIHFLFSDEIERLRRDLALAQSQASELLVLSVELKETKANLTELKATHRLSHIRIQLFVVIVFT